MKAYWHIDGPRKSPKSHCLAFDKLDGNNIRAEWHRKRGWSKFGTRTRLLDTTDPDFGIAIPLFMEKYSEPLVKVFKDEKHFYGVQEVIVYLELHGPNSFCGIHVPCETLTVTLIDVNPVKKGIVLPRDFIKMFGHLDIPHLIYEGNFGPKFVEDVRAGVYPVTFEGVVAKGILPGRKSDQHALWFSKVKTNKWLDELRKRATTDTRLVDVLRENVEEQSE